VRLLGLLCAVALFACAPAWKRAPHDVQFQRAAAPRPHAQPRSAVLPSDWWDHVLHSTVVPLAKLASPARYLDRVTGGREALDVNAFDEVPDSTWFTNRIGRAPMSAAEVARGAAAHGPPAPGPLTVISGKTEGATPGVVIRDASGAIWFVKFDPPAYPQLTTGAEIIGARLLHAAGYHVPEVQLVDLDLARVRLAPDATRRDRYDRQVPLTERDLTVLLLQLNPDSRGRLRALFSRAVPGRPLGPFSFRGVRSDDPNDRIPHERRRTLRALWLFSAWLNNTDTRRQNTLDTFVPGGGAAPHLGHVRHYLIDFGDSLGAAGYREKYVSEGYEQRVDWVAMAARWAALGLRYPYWLRTRRSPFRSVGIFESEVFDPARWSPSYPNPAFDEATARDTFWAAAVLARVTPELVAAAVAAADYREPGAAAWVTRVLLERRAKLLRHAFRPMLALVDPVVVDGWTVELTDLEARARLLPRPPRYRWSVRWDRRARPDCELAAGGGRSPRADLSGAVAAARRDDPDGFAAEPYLTLTVWRPRAGGAPGPHLELHLRALGDRLLPVALSREVR
jgi:hypothetical protein